MAVKTPSTSSSPPSGRSRARLAGITVRVCPSCGSTAIREVVAAWSGTFKGKEYRVPGLCFFACPRCGEHVYPPDTMRRIQASSPAFEHRHKDREFAEHIRSLNG